MVCLSVLCCVCVLLQCHCDREVIFFNLNLIPKQQLGMLWSCKRGSGILKQQLRVLCSNREPPPAPAVHHRYVFIFIYIWFS